MKRLASFILVWMLVPTVARLEPCCDANGQTEAEGSPRATVSVGPAGIRRHVSGKWATLAVNGMNRTAADTVETVTVIIGEDTNQQFARRLWVPSGATRQTWLPVQIPADLYIENVTIPMKSIQLKESGGVEQFQSNVIGMATSERSLLLSWDQSRTAVLFDRADRDGESDDRTQYLAKTVFAGRDSVAISVQDLGLVSLGAGFLPPSAKALDAIDQIVVASDMILDDTMSVQSIRSWLQSGGRLWIMADQISPDSVRMLLGDAACYSVVNRVELNDFEIEQIDTPAMTQAFDPVAWSSETPVEMLRVLVDTDDVQFRVDGWPAAFWKSVGNGEVLFTTLGARGWMEDDKTNRAYRDVASRFFLSRIEPPRHTKELITFLDDEIGYQIPSRASVSGLLGLHMLMVLVAGAWLVRQQKLQHLAIVIPLAAVISAGGLIALGNQQTAAVPSTIASAQNRACNSRYF